jgi:hypothetical protein
VPDTVIVPETALPEKSTVIELVFAPLTIVAPGGKVQLYPVAPEIAGTVKVTPVCPWQTGEVPVIAPAAAGIELTVIYNEEDTPFPQSFVPYTVMFPDVAPAEKLTVIVLVLAPPVIVAPGGNVQLYPVAFPMAGTE